MQSHGISAVTPEQFYHSKDWQRFRQFLILSRTNEDGAVICAECGKPILRKYDCIAHHKIELTEDNAGDASISLNPDNVELVHFACHNKRHERFEGFTQKVYLVYGSPCSGKTSFVNENARPDDLIFDIDRIWDAVCNGGRYAKERGKSSRPGRLTANVFGIRDAMLDQIRTRTGKWRAAWIIGGYPLRSDRDRLCDLLRAEPIYCEATIAECMARAEKERPDAWKGYIERWFADYTE